jgi:hypothetical protein
MVTCRMTDECNGDCLVVVVLANTKVGANNQLGPTARIRILQKRPARCCPPPPATAVWVGPYQMRNVARGLGGADVGRVLVHRRYLVHSVLQPLRPVRLVRIKCGEVECELERNTAQNHTRLVDPDVRRRPLRHDGGGEHRQTATAAHGGSESEGRTPPGGQGERRRRHHGVPTFAIGLKSGGKIRAPVSPCITGMIWNRMI